MALSREGDTEAGTKKQGEVCLWERGAAQRQRGQRHDINRIRPAPDLLSNSEMYFSLHMTWGGFSCDRPRVRTCTGRRKSDWETLYMPSEGVRKIPQKPALLFNFSGATQIRYTFSIITERFLTRFAAETNVLQDNTHLFYVKFILFLFVFLNVCCKLRKMISWATYQFYPTVFKPCYKPQGSKRIF